MSDIIPYKRPQAQLQTRHQTFKRGNWQSGNIYWSKGQSQSANIASKVLSGLQQAAGSGGGGGIFSRSFTKIRPGATLSAPLKTLAGKLQSVSGSTGAGASSRRGIFEQFGGAVRAGTSGEKYGLSKKVFQALRGKASIRGAIKSSYQQYVESVNPRAAKLAKIKKSRKGKRGVSKDYVKERARLREIDTQAKKAMDIAKKELGKERSRIDAEGKKAFDTAKRKMSEQRQLQEQGRLTVARLGGSIPTKGRAQYLANVQDDREEQARSQLTGQARLSGQEIASNRPTGRTFTQLSNLRISPGAVLKQRQNTLLVQGKGGISESQQNKLRQNTRDIKREAIAGAIQGGNVQERFKKGPVNQYNREVRSFNKQQGVGTTVAGVNTNIRKINPSDKDTVVFANAPERLAKRDEIKAKRLKNQQGEQNVTSINKQQRKIAKLSGGSASGTQIKRNPIQGGKKFVASGSPERQRQALSLRQQKLDKSGNYLERGDQKPPKQKSKVHPIIDINRIKEGSLKLKGFTSTSRKDGILGLDKNLTATGGKGLFRIKGGQVNIVSQALTNKGQVAVAARGVDRTLNATLQQSNAYILQKKQEEAKATGQKYSSSKAEGRKAFSGKGKLPQQGETDVKAKLSTAKSGLKLAKKVTDAEFLFKGLKAGTPEYYKAYYEQIKRQKLVRQGKLRGKRRNKKK